MTSTKFKEFKDFGNEFYDNVRCGILHQAETTGGWRITKQGKTLFKPASRIVNAKLFRENLNEVLDRFCGELKSADWDSDEWNNVFKKMEVICDHCVRKI